MPRFFFGHVWQLETAHRTVCHFVCPWPAFFPSPICCLLSHVWQRNGTRCGVPFRVPLAGFVLCAPSSCHWSASVCCGELSGLQPRELPCYGFFRVKISAHADWNLRGFPKSLIRYASHHVEIEMAQSIVLGGTTSFHPFKYGVFSSTPQAFCKAKQQKRLLVGLLLECRGFFSATFGSSKRHTAPCAISSALGLPSFLVQSAAS